MTSALPVGRVVHYASVEADCQSAVITAMTDPVDGERVATLCARSAQGVYDQAVPRTTYSADQAPNTWHWPWSH